MRINQISLAILNIFNNVIVGGNYGMIEYGADPRDTEYNYNCFYGQYTDLCDGECYVDYQEGNHNLLDIDPCFYYQDFEDGPALTHESPCINAGYNGEADIYQDATLVDEEEDLWFYNYNDMGCNGGPDAGVLDLKHYNIVDGALIENWDMDDFDDYHPEFQDVTEDGQDLDVDHLPRDEYEVLSSVGVTNTKELTLLKNTLFLLHDDVYFYVWGTINADGLVEDAGGDIEEDERLIRFDSYPGDDPWDYIWVYNPDDECELKGCDIRNCMRCVYAWSSVLVDPILTLTNSSLRYATTYNLHISEDAKVECNNCLITDGYGDGVYISNNGTGTIMDRCIIANNGTAANNNGMEIRSNSEPTLTRNSIKYNMDKGIIISDASNLALNGANDNANEIYNNGHDLGLPQDEWRGTEIRVITNSFLVAQKNNIWDVEKVEGSGYFRRGIQIANCPGGQIPCTATDNWWACGHLGVVEVLNQTQNWDDYFTWDNNCPVTIFDKSAAFNDIGDRDEPLSDWYYRLLDTADELENADALYAGGEYSDAITLYRRCISQDRSEAEKIKAMQRLLYCHRYIDADLSDLKEEFEEYAYDFEEYSTPVSWTSRKLSCYCTKYSGDLDGAIDEFAGIIDEAPNPSDSIFVLINILDVEKMIDADNIDRLFDYDRKIDELVDLLDEIDMAGDSRNPAEPVEFELIGAYPNPFNPVTEIRYYIPDAGKVKMSVYDVNGRLVNSLLDSRQEKGYHNVTWNASTNPAGVYFCRIEGEGFGKTVKLALVK